MVGTPPHIKAAQNLLLVQYSIGLTFVLVLGFLAAYRGVGSGRQTVFLQTQLDPVGLYRGSNSGTTTARELSTRSSDVYNGAQGLSKASRRVFRAPAKMSDSCRAVMRNMNTYCEDIKEKKCRVDYDTATMDVYQVHEDFEEELPACKTLWFAGFHMGENSQCQGEGGGYRAEYAAALASWMMHAHHTLQPVLVLAWQGVDNSTDKDFLTSWAEARGVIVINVNSFSFQDTLDAAGKQGRITGAFMRLDIPRLVEEHKLFNLPGVCSPEVLYTDSDVLFLNHISHKDMQVVKQGVRRDHTTITAYGSEFKFLSDHSVNTGVMIMNVDRFGSEWPKILKFAQDQNEFPGHDQILLNAYFAQEDNKDKVVGLPTFWSHKTYWPADIGLWHEIKVLHTHGPKPGSGLWHMADCDMNVRSVELEDEDYKAIVKWGTCCNQGVAANRVRDIVRAVEADLGVCP